MTHPITVKVLDPATGEYESEGLAEVLDARWLDQFNAPGSGTVRVPYGSASAAALRRDLVVEMWIHGDCWFAFPVESLRVVLGAEAAARVVEASGRGLLAWLADAVLLPSSGGTLSGTVRPFNFTSPDVAGHDLGVTWTAPTTSATAKPNNWPKGSTAAWVVPAGTGSDGAYLRSPSFTTATTRLRLFVACDSPFSVMLDGVEVMSMSARTGSSDCRTLDLTAPAGPHRLGIVSSSVTAKAIASLHYLDTTTDKVGAAVATTSTSWESCKVTPAWTVGDVLATAMADAVARGVDRVGYLSPDFTAAVDTSGTPWATRAYRDWPAGTSLLALATDLCELGCDAYAAPWSRELQLHGSRGYSRPGVVLAVGSNLRSYEAQASYQGVSRLYVPLDGGQSWLTRDDAGKAAVLGVREAAAQSGDAIRTADLTDWAQATIDAATPGTIVLSADCIPVPGAEPYLDFAVGDTITAPDVDGDPVAARVLSLAVYMDGEGYAFAPELELGTATRRRAWLDPWQKVSEALNPGGSAAEDPVEEPEPPFGTDDPGAEWPPVPPVTVSDAEPADPDDGDMWVDPVGGIVSVWQDDPGEWAPVGGAGGAAEVWIGTTAPDPVGDYVLWVDTS